MGKNGTKRYLKNKAVERVAGIFLSSEQIGATNGLAFILSFLADVTLDDCANNPRKIQFSKVKVNLKNIGKKFP